MFILKEVKVVCFDTLLQVLILKGVMAESSFDSLGSLRTRILRRMLGFDPDSQVFIVMGLGAAFASKFDNSIGEAYRSSWKRLRLGLWFRPRIGVDGGLRISIGFVRNAGFGLSLRLGGALGGRR